MQPKVSVIIPVYNVEKYLRECLDSVVNQTLKDIEIICVNDGSTDNSLEILKEYEKQDSRIKIIDKKNEGVAAARNDGIRIANGEFVCFIDPDDYYPLVDILEDLYTNAKQNNVYICGGEFSCFTNNDRNLTQNYGDTFEGYLFPENKLIKYSDYQFDYGYHRFIYNKNFLLQNKIFFPKYKRFQDPPFMVNAMITAGNFYALNKITYAYRHGHQAVKWTKEKIYDLLHGILDNLKYADRYHLSKLSEYSENRLMQHWRFIEPMINLKCWFIIGQMRKYNTNIAHFYYENFIKKIINNIFSFNNDDRKLHKVITVLGMKFKIRRKFMKNILENIFSVRNDDRKMHKIITFLGIKIKIKNARKNITNFENLKTEIRSEIMREFRGELNNLRRNFEYKLCKYMPEEKYPEYLKDWYYEKTGEELNLKNPQTFNEKLQWLKLYDSTPFKTMLADKYLVRDWVKEKIGEEYLIPLLGVWENFDDIDFDKLPDKFVLKTNHGSGWNMIIKDKSKFNKQQAKYKFDKWMHTNFAYVYGFELHYKNIKPLIIAEKYLETEDGDLKDYKFLCFNGEVKYVWVDKDRYCGHKRNIYDTNWNLLDKKIAEGHIYDNFAPCEKPYTYEKMLQFAKILSQNINFVRVDFYEHNQKLYFGEMTFTSASGLHVYSPATFNYELGSLIDLTNNTFEYESEEQCQRLV